MGTRRREEMRGKCWGYHQAQPSVRGGLPTSGRLGKSCFQMIFLNALGFPTRYSFTPLSVLPGSSSIPAGGQEHLQQESTGAGRALLHLRQKGGGGALPSHLPGQQRLTQARDPAPIDGHPEVRSDSSSQHCTCWVFRTRKALPTKRPAALSLPKGSKPPQNTVRVGGAGGRCPVLCL